MTFEELQADSAATPANAAAIPIDRVIIAPLNSLALNDNSLVSLIRPRLVQHRKCGKPARSTMQ
ncbi:hypothetical protein KEU06_13415 [Pseudaminobacter sp. 19-2017]|uniref:Uncharacterized protein n=1 Tax=Pseudaminobacter soli (ex Zhang et al. 2022) TaxID=2831468 RepID=A0A942I310_9HYPH|nr:hypothetical protein [Pseudaminobacter soli]MBS3649608.1 hypothetical protein [Pseudaminobacter soli]